MWIPRRVVHLELHTDNLARACDFYGRLFAWRTEPIHTSAGSYLSLGLGGDVDGGVVEHDAEGACWLPYVQVPHIEEAAAVRCGSARGWSSSRVRARRGGAACCTCRRAGTSRSGCPSAEPCARGLGSVAQRCSC